MNWGETSNLFSQGLVAMRIDNDSQFLQVTDKSKSLVWDKVGFATVPAGPFGLSSCNVAPWAVAVPTYSTKKAAAWEFVKWATSKEISLGAMQAGQFGARQSVWKNPEATKGLPADLVAAVQGNMGTKYSEERPIMVQVGKARDIIGKVIQAAIEGKSDAEVKSIADKANAEFQALLDQDYK
jgi:multiple sugar transport system substrate-binding protein